MLLCFGCLPLLYTYSITLPYFSLQLMLWYLDCLPCLKACNEIIFGFLVNVAVFGFLVNAALLWFIIKFVIAGFLVNVAVS